VTGGNGLPISDGVDQPTVRTSDTFPYLAPPNPNPAAVGGAVVPSKLADQLQALQDLGLASR